MNNLFNKTSSGFLLRFALILTLSFGVLMLVDYLETPEHESYLPSSAQKE